MEGEDDSFAPKCQTAVAFEYERWRRADLPLVMIVLLRIGEKVLASMKRSSQKDGHGEVVSCSENHLGGATELMLVVAQAVHMSVDKRVKDQEILEEYESKDIDLGYKIRPEEEDKKTVRRAWGIGKPEDMHSLESQRFGIEALDKGTLLAVAKPESMRQGVGKSMNRQPESEKPGCIGSEAEDAGAQVEVR